MPVRPWAAVPAAAVLLAAHAATAAATDTVADPTPTPSPTPTPTVPGLPDLPDTAGSVIYVVTVTTTVTTTTVTAPITVVAAPITTTVNNNSATTNSATTNAGTPAAVPGAGEATSRRGRMEINLRGCRPKGASGDRFAPLHTQVRLPRNTRLVVNVNGRRVGELDLDGGREASSKPLPLRIKVRRDGMLSIWRPSGRVLATQGCSAR